jgi:signal transduction histidine kinase
MGEKGSSPGEEAEIPLARGLSGRLLVLTVLIVLLAEVLIFVPSVANFRLGWLQNRLDTAGAASFVIANADPKMLPRNVQDDVLQATGAHAIAIKDAKSSRLLAVSEMPPNVTQYHDLRAATALGAIHDAMGTLFLGGDKVLRVRGNIGGSDRMIELVMDDAKLRAAMLIYSRNVAVLSLIISLITAALVFSAINRMMIRPIRRMTRSMLAFAAAPDDRANIINPEGRRDEIGLAERKLSAMQDEIHQTLAQRRHLADLGLAVSKINHDMRNILSAAQLMSDRLADARDPLVQSVAPKLIRTLDRAVGYTTDVLSYGGASEAPPSRRRVLLRAIVEDVFGLNTAPDGTRIAFVNAVGKDHEIDADPDQLFRVLNNLVRNAVQAMSSERDAAVVKRMTVSAERTGTIVAVKVEDTGPGLPAKARENLFTAFRGSARPGGTGLGLVIAHEIVRAHGGEIQLLASESGMTVFLFTIPDRPISLDQARSERRSA